MTAASRLSTVLASQAPESAVFTPLVSGLVARLAQLPYDTLVHSPDAAAAAYRDAARLLRLEFVTVGLDPSILAEAAGVAVEWTDGGGVAGSAAPDAVDADAAVRRGAAAATIAVAERVVRVLEDSAVVAGSVPSPLLLARILIASEHPDADLVRAAGRLVIAYSRALCEARIGALIVVDAADAGDFDLAERKAERVIANTARHFEIPLLRVCHARTHRARTAFAEGVLPVDGDVVTDRPAAVPIRPGASVPTGAWFTSAGELAPETRPEDLHELIAAVAAASVPD